MTMTGSPMSRNGVYFGFLLPLSTLAASVARRPRVLPLASTTNHLRSISCALGIYVDIALSFSSTIEPESRSETRFPIQTGSLRPPQTYFAHAQKAAADRKFPAAYRLLFA